jgi:hypothetical protein
MWWRYMANVSRMMVDLDKLFALLDRRVNQAEREGRTDQEAPDDVVRAVEVAERMVTLLGDMTLTALEKSIADTRRQTDVGRFTLQAINHCFSTGRPVPESVQKSFERIYAKERTYKSWDRAFGQPRKRAKHLTSLGDIERLVLVAKSNGQPIDNQLFEAIGRKLGIGGSTKVKELYSLLKDGKTPR